MSATTEVYGKKPLATVAPNETLLTAWRIMREKGIRHLPVAESGGGIVGILTDRDLQRAIHTEFDEAGGVRFTIERFAPTERVSDYMTVPVQTVQKETSLIEVARRMRAQKISSLIVVDDREAIGIVTTDDLLGALIDLSQSPKDSALDQIMARVYQSPIGAIVQSLSNAGL